MTHATHGDDVEVLPAGAADSLGVVRRMLRIITVLSSGRHVDPDVLAQDLGVSRRTVFRDLRTMQAAGIPCHFDPRRRSYVISDGFVLPALNLTPREAHSLLLMTRQLLTRAAVPFYEDALRAAIKVESALPREVRRECETLLDGVGVVPPPASAADAIASAFTVIQEAIVARRKLQIAYDGSGHETETVVHPYRLAFLHRQWFVVGHSEPDDRVVHLALERVIRIESMDALFLDGDDFDLDAYLGNAWAVVRGNDRHRVRLRFDSDIADEIEEIQWHHTQRTERLEDGRLVFEADVDGLGEVTAWVLGYGDQVVVEAPIALKRRVAETAQRIAALYGPPPTRLRPARVSR